MVLTFEKAEDYCGKRQFSDQRPLYDLYYLQAMPCWKIEKYFFGGGERI
jgi:hypothetical protein